MTPSVVFFTVTRSIDYDLLLGSIEHHALLGRHVVLDTTMPMDGPRSFKNLPSTVTWIHEPVYGSGWKEFRYVAAAQRALAVALAFKPDVLGWLDSDEFLAELVLEDVVPQALHAVVDLMVFHWKRDGHAYMYGESEWHARLWPAWAGVTIGKNLAWPQHTDYNGNPEHHAVPYVPPNVPRLRIPGPYRHHVHYAIGPKMEDEETAATTISGWASGGHRIPDVEWPAKLALWRSRGIRPSEAFS